MAGVDETNEIIMRLVDKVSRVEALLEGLVDHQFVAKERNEIRAETRQIVADALQGRDETMRALMEARTSELREYAKKYTDERVRDLERQIEDRQARDEAIASNVRRSFAMSVGVAIAGMAYALYNLFKTGGV